MSHINHPSSPDLFQAGVPQTTYQQCQSLTSHTLTLFIKSVDHVVISINPKLDGMRAEGTLFIIIIFIFLIIKILFFINEGIKDNYSKFDISSYIILIYLFKCPMKIYLQCIHDTILSVISFYGMILMIYYI